jgi:arginine exporter protein ArgO
MDATSALLAGLGSGAAIATQFGAVSALLVETAVAAGPRPGVAAGLGVATADLAFAAAAVAAGGAARAALAGHEAELRALAAITLATIAVRGLRSILRNPAAADSARAYAAASARRASSSAKEYMRFVAITAINPLTIVYFASVAATLSLTGFASRVAFAVGAGTASAAWHASLTLVAGHAGRRITPAIQRAIGLAGRLIVIALAFRLALAV